MTTRIAFFGNVANAQYPMVRALRAIGVDAHLFIDRRDPPPWRPETDDPSLLDGYPEWIHEGQWVTPGAILAPFRSALAKELQAFDIVIGSGNGPMYTQFTSGPSIFFTTGGDLTVRPFPLEFRTRSKSIGDFIASLVMGAWQRRGIRRSDAIWTQPFRPFVDALDRLDVHPNRRADCYIPLAVDTEQFSPDGTIDEWAAGLREGADLVVFHPSRVIVDESPRMLRSGQTKGSASMIRAFARFAHTERGSTARLLLIDHPFAAGAAAARSLVDELGITDRVQWLEAERPSGFTRREMVQLYRTSDLTINELGAGWFGWAALESLACGTPVLSRLDLDVMDQLYPGHVPWFNVDGDVELTTTLGDLATDRDRIRRQGIEGRDWILRHHSFAAVSRRLIEALNDFGVVVDPAPAASPTPAAPPRSRSQGRRATPSSTGS